jgi:3-deoxy-D-manno-octulosonic-acid transferase
VEVCGNLKFDFEPPPRMLAKGLEWRTSLAREVVALVYSREGEEEALLDLWSLQPLPRPLLLIAPRQDQRCADVAQLARRRGLSVARRSEWRERPSSSDSQVDVWIGDNAAEMPVYFAASDVCLLGGSYGDFGGHSPIEAAASACPVIIGPSIGEHTTSCTLAMRSRAAMRVTSMAEGLHRAVAMAHDPQRNEWVERALNFAAMHRGARVRTVACIAEVALAPRAEVTAAATTSSVPQDGTSLI